MSEKIFINGRFLTKATTGVQRYAFEIVKQFDMLLDEAAYQNLRVTCLVPPEKRLQPQWRNIEVLEVGLTKGNLWEQVDLPFHARGHFLFSPANIGPIYYANQAVTFHDASVFAMPEAYSAAFRIKYWFALKHLARTARLILTDSLFSQGELARHLGAPRQKFNVISLGGDHLNDTQAEAGILKRYSLEKTLFFLTVASQSPHKNLGLVFQAAQALSERITFVAVGGSFKTIFRATRQQLIPPNLLLPGYVRDGELRALYENALGFVCPSLYEGFGLPILEAMNFGCPVLSSNAASLPEVGGQAVIYFDPQNPNDLVKLLGTFLSDANLQDRLRMQGKIHAQQYTWEQTARATLAAFQLYL